MVQTTIPGLYGGPENSPILYATIAKNPVYENVLNSSLRDLPSFIVDFKSDFVDRKTIKQAFLKEDGDFMFCLDGRKYILYFRTKKSAEEDRLILGKNEIEELPDKYRLITVTTSGEEKAPVETMEKTMQSIIDAKNFNGLNLKLPRLEQSVARAETAASGKKAKKSKKHRR